MANFPFYYEGILMSMRGTSKGAGTELWLDGEELAMDNGDFVRLSKELESDEFYHVLHINNPPEDEPEKDRHALGRDGVEALADAIRKNTALVHLSLEGLEIDDAHAQILAEALAENTALNSISFKHNAISDKGGLALVRAAFKNRNLSQISLQGNPFTPAGKRRIAAELAGSGEKRYVIEMDAPDPRLERYCRDNTTVAIKMRMDLEQDLSGLDTAYLLEMNQRMPLIYNQFMDGKVLADIPMAQNSIFQKQVKKLEAELATRPVPDYGILQKADTPDTPASWVGFEAAVKAFDPQKGQVRQELLDARTGEATPLLQGIASMRLSHILFAETNWLGAPSQEMKRVYRALPESERMRFDVNALAMKMDKYLARQHRGMARQ